MTKEFYNRPYMVSKAPWRRFTIEEMSTYVEQLLNAENDAAKQKALVAIEDLTEQRMNELNVVRSLFKADPGLLERFERLRRAGRAPQRHDRRSRSGRITAPSTCTRTGTSRKRK